MLRLVDINEITSSGITFQTEEISSEDAIAYVVYDTSTGIPISTMEDYVVWRTTTTKTSTGATTVEFTINNNNLYPSYSTPILNYTLLNPRLFSIMTLHEYQILDDVLIRLDLVRRRLPNPGVGISSTDGIGQDGIVAFTGGFEKKMTVKEIMRMIEGTIVEINSTPPRTNFWPVYLDIDLDKKGNPYLRGGFPMDMFDLTRLGSLIRCLIAVGILEVDISFSTSDSGLQLSFERHSHIKGWHDALLTEYKEQKALFKWNHCAPPTGVGTFPWAAMGIWGTLMNNVTQGGQLALHSVLGFTARGNVPM